MTETVELYKRFRPNTWDGLIGQDKVAASLKNAVLSNRIPTAFLFSGPRGTGKTSAAFILAKALNCENRKSNGDPCNECYICEGIDNNNLIGFNYISMANKGSVDDVRSIVNQATLNQPVNKQVWILDEVHNLSKQAFDSLLIPVEKKKMDALFIFCTTEIEKIPQTILSRVWQRKLKLVEPKTMTQYLEDLVKNNSLNISEEQIQDAVRMGRGSVRDSLSALDEIIDVGSSSNSFGDRLLEALSDHSIPSILSIIAEANNENINFRDFAEQLYSDLRDLILINSDCDRELTNLPLLKDEAKVISGLKGAPGISYSMKEVGEAITLMVRGADQRISFEMALVNIASKLSKVK